MGMMMLCNCLQNEVNEPLKVEKTVEEETGQSESVNGGVFESFVVNFKRKP
jgi:hypothetical protein